MRRLFSVALVSMVFLPAGLSTGCTAVGALAGTAIDGSKEKVVEPVGDACEIHDLKSGTEVAIRRQNGLKVQGRYEGLDWTLTQERLVRYETDGRALARERDLPVPGPGASVTLTGDRVASGELVGYGSAFLVFREHTRDPAARLALDRVVELTDAAGRTVTGPRLEDVLSTAPIPMLAGLRLEQADGTKVIPCDDIRTVSRLERPNRGLKAGLIVGAILDIIWIIAGLTGQFG